MKWITREKPKIDRIACPWLIKRFIDPEAQILYVPDEEVRIKADAWNAIPFDVPEVEFTHYGEECTFDYFLKKYALEDPALQTLALIVRGADTDRYDLAAQSSGLWAISAGLSFNCKSDQEMLEKGLVIYDALYTWARYFQHEKHTLNTTERLLIEVYHRFLRQKKESKKIPVWATELKMLIQDQLDTHFNLSLKEISQSLKVHPAYLSREFSKYFDDLSFGDYIRKLRIEKAMGMMALPTYSLTEIAYLTGFSDQSHFTRIFKKYIGESPSSYRRKILKK